MCNPAPAERRPALTSVRRGARATPDVRTGLCRVQFGLCQVWLACERLPRKPDRSVPATRARPRRRPDHRAGPHRRAVALALQRVPRPAGTSASSSGAPGGPSCCRGCRQGGPDGGAVPASPTQGGPGAILGSQLRPRHGRQGALPRARRQSAAIGARRRSGGVLESRQPVRQFDVELGRRHGRGGAPLRRLRDVGRRRRRADCEAHPPRRSDPLRVRPTRALPGSRLRRVPRTGWSSSAPPAANGQAGCSRLVKWEPVVFGNGWDASRLGRPAAGVRQRVRRVVGEARWNLNLLRPQNRTSHNMRTFEIPGCGGRQLAPSSADHERFLHATDSCLFDDFDELAAVLDSSTSSVSGPQRANGMDADRLSGHSYRSRAATLVDKVQRGSWYSGSGGATSDVDQRPARADDHRRGRHCRRHPAVLPVARPVARGHGGADALERGARRIRAGTGPRLREERGRGRTPGGRTSSS